MSTGLDEGAGSAGGCCGRPDACVFAKAVVARAASCALARRQSIGEREFVVCSSALALADCATLVALLRERATFALKLPRSAAPIEHVKALRLQCGGVLALQRELAAEVCDVHRLVGMAQERWGSLVDAPWQRIVPLLAAWQPRRRRRRDTAP